MLVTSKNKAIETSNEKMVIRLKFFEFFPIDETKPRGRRFQVVSRQK